MVRIQNIQTKRQFLREAVVLAQAQTDDPDPDDYSSDDYSKMPYQVQRPSMNLDESSYYRFYVLIYSLCS